MKTGEYNNLSRVIELSGKRKWSLKKLLDNWLLVIFISLMALTLKVAAEQLVMLVRVR